MSVLIKDMDMPETCDDCPFHVYHSHYEYVCIATPMFYPMNLANSKGIRKDWCPLVETPEPCGDAISRQAAIDAVCSVCGCDCDKSEFVYNAPQEEQVILCPEHYVLMSLPSAQPEPLSDAYTKAVWTLISRQYILDAFAEYIEEYKEVDEKGNHDPKWCAMKEAEMVVKEAPSVEPEIVRCKDCKWKQGSECVRFAEVRPFPDDFCSRAEKEKNHENSNLDHSRL